MKITIVGCGQAGLIHAGKMFEKGHEITLLKTSNVMYGSFFEKINREGGFKLIDASSSQENEIWVVPHFITRDYAAAIKDADVIFITTTTLQHEEIAKKIAPFVKDGQIITLVPSYLSSLIFKKYIDEDVIYSEWETTAYNGRIIDEAYVRISFYNPRNAISVSPKKHEAKVLEMFSSMFENTKYLRKNILESALHNPNLIVHPIGVLFSAARIEYSKGEFWIYKEAFSESVANVIRQFDKERNAVLALFGGEYLSYFDAAKWRNEEDLSKDSYEVFIQSFAESSDKGPSSLNTRYLYEDVPMGLCLLSSLGEVLDIPTPIADSIVHLASALLDVDFWEQGRDIEQLVSAPNLVNLATVFES